MIKKIKTPDNYKPVNVKIGKKLSVLLDTYNIKKENDMTVHVNEIIKYLDDKKVSGEEKKEIIIPLVKKFINDDIICSELSKILLYVNDKKIVV